MQDCSLQIFRAYSELVWTTIRGKYNILSPSGRGWGEALAFKQSTAIQDTL